MPGTVTWPHELERLLAGIAPAEPGIYRTDLDVDAKTLFDLNDFEAKARHRMVRFAGADGTPLLGEMNTVLGLGAPRAEGGAAIGRIRISFHAVVPAPPPKQTGAA
jgi:hypothetical protein